MSTRWTAPRCTAGTCPRHPGPDGTCDRHTRRVPAATRRILRTNTRGTRTLTARPDSGDGRWTVSAHAHQWDHTGRCAITGCTREQPTWLADDPTADRPGPARTSGPLTGKKIAQGIAAAIAVYALLSGVGHVLSDRIAEPVTPNSSLFQP